MQGSRFKSQRLWHVNGSHPGHGGKIFSDCTSNNKTLPTEHKSKLIYSDVPNCLSVCIAGCWNGSLLAKEIPYMHVNNITDSNSDSNLFTLQLRAHVVLILCYLCRWSFLPLTSAFTLVAHVVLHLLLALVVFFYLQLPHLLYCHMWWSHCYLHCVVVYVYIYF